VSSEHILLKHIEQFAGSLSTKFCVSEEWLVERPQAIANAMLRRVLPIAPGLYLLESVVVRDCGGLRLG
jgi:hypothetical protein